jgi:hypothetical protein
MNGRSLSTQFGHAFREPSRRQLQQLRDYARESSHELVTRERVEAQVATPPSVETILELVTLRRHGAACVAALAHAVAGREVPVEVMEAVLPGVHNAVAASCLVAVTSGDRASALLRLVEDRRFRGPVEVELSMTALFAAWRVGERQLVRPRLIPLLHALLGRALCPESGSLLAILVREIDDDALSAATTARVDPTCRRWMSQVEAALSTSPQRVLERLVVEQDVVRNLGATPVRSGPRVGRNEPCPCGSGRKAKRCCNGTEPAQVDDATRVDDTIATPAAAVHALATIGSLLDAQKWEAAGRALDDATTAAALTPAELDALRLQLITGALFKHHYDLARGHRAKMSDPAKPLTGPDMVLAIVDRRPDAIDQIGALAAAALRAEPARPTLGYAMAISLLQIEPALGLLVGRAVLKVGHPDTERLLTWMTSARARLNLPPDDPWRRVYDAATEAEELRCELDRVDAARAELVREVGPLRATVTKAEGRQRSLESLLAERDASLAVVQSELAALSDVARAEDERRALRSKISDLKEIIRIGVEERQQLRQDLAERKAADESKRSQRHAVAEGEAGEADLEVVTTPPVGRSRGPLVPCFESGATHALRRVSGTVAAESLRTVGELAAGDTGAWLRVKQARDMRTPLYLVRIGIHHRMLARIDGDALVIVDLVSREDMDLAIQRLRSLT